MINIAVLGSGCTNCKNLETMCREVIAENNIEAEIQKVTDIKDIMAYGILSTPGLVVNGKVVLSGKVPSKSSLTKLLVDAAV